MITARRLSANRIFDEAAAVKIESRGTDIDLMLLARDLHAAAVYVAMEWFDAEDA